MQKDSYNTKLVLLLYGNSSLVITNMSCIVRLRKFAISETGSKPGQKKTERNHLIIGHSRTRKTVHKRERDTCNFYAAYPNGKRCRTQI